MLSHLNVYFGTGYSFSLRNELRRFLKDRGGSESITINSRTTHLLCGAERDTPKTNKARSHGIPIVLVQWLVDCRDQGAPLPHVDYIWSPKSSASTTSALSLPPADARKPLSTSSFSSARLNADPLDLFTVEFDPAKALSNGTLLPSAPDQQPLRRGEAPAATSTAAPSLRRAVDGDDRAHHESPSLVADDPHHSPRASFLHHQDAVDRKDEDISIVDEFIRLNRIEEAREKKAKAEADKLERRRSKLAQVQEGLAKAKQRSGQQSAESKDRAREALKQRRKAEKAEKKARRRRWLERQKEHAARQEKWASQADARAQSQQKWAESVARSAEEKGRKLFIGNVRRSDITIEICGTQHAMEASISQRKDLMLDMFRRWGPLERVKDDKFSEKGYMFVVYHNESHAHKARKYLSKHGNRVRECNGAKAKLLKEGRSTLCVPHPSFYVRIPRAELCDSHPHLCPPSKPAWFRAGSVDAVFASMDGQK